MPIGHITEIADIERHQASKYRIIKIYLKKNQMKLFIISQVKSNYATDI